MTIRATKINLTNIWLNPQVWIIVICIKIILFNFSKWNNKNLWLQSFGTRLQNRIFAVAIFSVSKLWLSSKWFYDFILLSLNSKWYHNSYGCSSDIIFQMWNPKFSLLKIGYWNSKMTNKNIKFIQIFIGGLENDLKPYGRYVRTRIIMIKLNVYILALLF